MAFHVGQKVVCVETWVATPGYGAGDEIGPIKGVVYTIREIGFALNPGFESLQCRLLEIQNPTRAYASGIYEGAFRATRFRPIVERKTDISFAHEILRKHTKKRSIDA